MKQNHLPVGTVIDGRYRTQKLLGAGGYGEVHLAEQIQMERPVALKLLHARLTNEENSIKRFQQEARFACRLQDPNTVIYHDFGSDRNLGIFYLAMEFIQGESLAQRLKSRGPLSLEETLHILEQACGALHEAHEIGLVHRDVKPGNIMLTRRGNQDDFVKVIDFGIAKTVGSNEHEEELTTSGTIIGSPSYMAPEQIQSNTHPIDRRTDVYALGCMVYKMLTGLPPFRGSTAVEIATQHLVSPPPAISSLTRSPLPPLLDELMQRTLSKNPNDRPESAPALANAFRDILNAPETVSPIPAPGWNPRQKRNFALLFMLLLAAAGLVLGVGGLLFKKHLQSRENPTIAIEIQPDLQDTEHDTTASPIQKPDVDLAVADKDLPTQPTPKDNPKEEDAANEVTENPLAAIAKVGSTSKKPPKKSPPPKRTKPRANLAPPPEKTSTPAPPEPIKTTPSTQEVSIRVNPWADSIRIGSKTSTGRTWKGSLSAGTHRVTVTKYQSPKTFHIKIVPGKKSYQIKFP